MDLIRNNLIGNEDASYRRDKIGQILGIGYGNAKQFLSRLNNYGVTREEFIEKVYTEFLEAGLLANGIDFTISQQLFSLGNCLRDISSDKILPMSSYELPSTETEIEEVINTSYQLTMLHALSERGPLLIKLNQLKIKVECLLVESTLCQQNQLRLFIPYLIKMIEQLLGVKK